MIGGFCRFWVGITTQSCVCLSMQVKKGNLSETSPMLNDISGVLSWEKVNSGLLKMYKVGFPFLFCVNLSLFVSLTPPVCVCFFFLKS